MYEPILGDSLPSAPSDQPMELGKVAIFGDRKMRRLSCVRDTKKWRRTEWSLSTEEKNIIFLKS